MRVRGVRSFRPRAPLIPARIINHTNSPSNSQVVVLSSLTNENFNDEVDKAMKVHMDSLLQAQNVVCDAICCLPTN